MLTNHFCILFNQCLKTFYLLVFHFLDDIKKYDSNNIMNFFKIRIVIVKEGSIAN